MITQGADFRAWVHNHGCDCVCTEFEVQNKHESEYLWVDYRSMVYKSINAIIIGLILKLCILDWI